MGEISKKMFNNSPFKVQISKIEDTVSLPTLEGTDKQISWANEIRMDRLLQDCEPLFICRKHLCKIGKEHAIDELITEVIDYYSIERQAAVWINTPPSRLMFPNTDNDIANKLRQLEQEYRDYRKQKTREKITR